MDDEPDYEGRVTNDNESRESYLSEIERVNNLESLRLKAWLTSSEETRAINLALVSEEIDKTRSTFWWKLCNNRFFSIGLEHTLFWQYFSMFILFFLNSILIIANFKSSEDHPWLLTGMLLLNVYAVYLHFCNNWIYRLGISLRRFKKNNSDDVLTLFSTLVNNDLFDAACAKECSEYNPREKLKKRLTENNDGKIAFESMKIEVLKDALIDSKKKYLFISPLLYRYYDVFFKILEIVKITEISKKEMNNAKKALGEWEYESDDDIKDKRRDFLIKAIEKINK